MKQLIVIFQIEKNQVCFFGVQKKILCTVVMLGIVIPLQLLRLALA